MEVLILGSNSAAFAYKRHHTSQLLKHQNRYFLIDCGEGTQLRLKRFRVKLNKIQVILISHLHGDHYFGLLGLMNTMHLFGRKNGLKIIGPPGLRDILQLQLSYSNTALNYPVQFTEWVPDTTSQVYEDDHLTIKTLPLQHRIPTSGYLIREKEKPRKILREAIPDSLAPVEAQKLKRGEDVVDISGRIKYKNNEVTADPAPPYSYAFCSDTKFDPSLPEKIKGVDVLYHESSFLEDMKDRAGAVYHSTAKEAAEIAKRAQVKQLLLGHFSSRYQDIEPFKEEASTVFQNVELAREGETFVIE